MSNIMSQVCRCMTTKFPISVKTFLHSQNKISKIYMYVFNYNMSCFIFMFFVTVLGIGEC